MKKLLSPHIVAMLSMLFIGMIFPSVAGLLSLFILATAIHYLFFG